MKIIVRVKGGLGNQLFCYAAARQLAVKFNAELVIDNISGFSRDFQYKRRYQLSNFCIECRMANDKERLEPFSRLRRRIHKYLSENYSRHSGLYLAENNFETDDRILDFEPKDGCYIDGLWQNEKYFKDITDILRKDLTFLAPKDLLNIDMQVAMRESNSVGIHVRWFETPGASAVNNISVDYYNQAMALIEKKVKNPQYFIFSDNPSAAVKKLKLGNRNAVLVDHNVGELGAHSDMWLMSNCKHMIIANSTFSWWGAWLIQGANKVVVYPNLTQESIGINQVPWSLKGLQPLGWVGA
jgi:hypothetical protein